MHPCKGHAQAGTGLAKLEGLAGCQRSYITVRSAILVPNSHPFSFHVLTSDKHFLGNPLDSPARTDAGGQLHPSLAVIPAGFQVLLAAPGVHLHACGTKERAVVRGFQAVDGDPQLHIGAGPVGLRLG